MARSLGTGGVTGLGSIVYALTLMSKCLRHDDLLADAHLAAELFTDEVIAADKQLDVMGGSAGGILGLVRLYRETRSGDVLMRATKCGDHLLGQSRVGRADLRSWSGQGSSGQVLNGMSHGAAGYAYALALLSAATGRADFAKAAWECIAFENSNYDPERNNWPDSRDPARPTWPCQWCHGAVGVGLARLAMSKRCEVDSRFIAADIRNAVDAAERRWPSAVDTLCCGTLGSIELLWEAGGVLARTDFRDLASRRLMTVVKTAAAKGDYRWNIGHGKFNLGLFRGLAGVGYTILRQVDQSLPNVVIME
jgi:lantibiotic modifying enzyme